MTLSDLASVGNLVSALAVLASLVFLSRQLRQAERNQQASVRAARAARMMDFFMGLAEPSLAEAVLKGMSGADDITEAQVWQFLNYAYARFFNAEDAFYQHRAGTLDDHYIEGVAAGLRNSLGTPGLRAIYRFQRGVFGREFVEFADQILAETPVSAGVFGLATFKAGVAAELAAARG